MVKALQVEDVAFELEVYEVSSATALEKMGASATPVNSCSYYPPGTLPEKK